MEMDERVLEAIKEIDPPDDEMIKVRLAHRASRLLAEGVYYDDNDKIMTAIVMLSCMSRFQFTCDLCFSVFGSNLRVTYFLLHKSEDGVLEFMKKAHMTLSEKGEEYESFIKPVIIHVLKGLKESYEHYSEKAGEKDDNN